jgi:probable rRNA maturation factor
LPITLLNRQSRKVDRLRLRRVARAVIAAEGGHPQAELNVVIGDDAWIQDLNKTYHGVETPTDVLAFPQDMTPEGEDPLLGDVAISAETAERQAQELGHSLGRELEILLAHGLLHLTGWEDHTPARRRRMMARALTILSELGEAEAP